MHFNKGVTKRKSLHVTPPVKRTFYIYSLPFLVTCVALHVRAQPLVSHTCKTKQGKEKAFSLFANLIKKYAPLS